VLVLATKLIAHMLLMQGKLSIEGDYLIVRPWLSVEYVDMQQPCISLTKLEITIAYGVNKFIVYVMTLSLSL